MVYAIPASNITAALEHGHRGSLHPKIALALARAKPKRFYIYTQDRVTIFSRERSLQTITELARQYNQVLFWTGNHTLDNPKGFPLDVETLNTLHRGVHSSLSILATMRTGLPFLPGVTDISGGTMWSDCALPVPCIQVDIRRRGSPVIPIEFKLFAVERLNRIPTQWRVEGSNFGEKWHAVTANKKQAQEFYAFNINQSFYNYYRFIQMDSPFPESLVPNNWPTGIQFFISLKDTNHSSNKPHSPPPFMGSFE